ncbi:unnamed protein product [Trichobilharzia regenti]|nr:unnamed protein product [Trichobilharzia regenti]
MYDCILVQVVSFQVNSFEYSYREDELVNFEGVLPEHIRFLLCLATPSEIWLLGMMYSNGSNTHTLGMQSPSPVLEVMPDPLYYLSTENNYISCIEGTPNGRIFLGTREGFLLEMTYSSIPNWEGASVQPNISKSGPYSIVQLSVDTPRHLLYTRTEDSRLTVYEFTDKISGSFSRLIISVTPLSSGLCYLMAVTRTGIRLYFGENLRLLHIRLPPSSPFDTVGLSEVKLAVETRGTVVMISTLPPSNASTTTLNNSSRSRFKSSYPVTESFMATQCIGGAWAMTVLPDNHLHMDSFGSHLAGYSTTTAIDKR